MKRAALFLLGFLLLALVYVPRVAPTITTGDAGELAAVGGTLGIGHSPGYPLYALLGRVGCALLPVASVGYRMSLQSAFWSAAAAAMASLCVWELTGAWAASVLTLGLLGLSPLWLGQALVTEVFGLNSFLAAAVLWLCLRPVRPLFACLVALLWGLGLGNNHTLILLAPAMLWAFWPLARKRNYRLALAVAAFAAVGFAVYLYIPLRAARIPLMDWEEPATWDRFWKLVTRARYGSFQIAQGTSPPMSWEDLSSQVIYFAETLWRSWSFWSLAAAIGIWQAFRRERRRDGLTLLIAFLCAGPGFLWLTHLRATAHTRVLLERFLYLPFIPAAILLGYGLHVCLKWIGRRTHAKKVFVSAAAVVIGAGWLGARSLPSERSNFLAWDLGKDIIRNTPPNALLLADRADEAEFAIAYLQRIERERPDIEFVDCNAGVSRSIYGPTYYDIWGRLRLAIRTSTERALIDQGVRPVYYATHEPNMIPIRRLQEGLVFAAPPGWRYARRRLPWQDILVMPRLGAGKAFENNRDRGLLADYLDMLSREAFDTRDIAGALHLHHGAVIYGQL